MSIEEDMVDLPKANAIWLKDNESLGTEQRLSTRDVNASTGDARKDGHESNVQYMDRVDITYATIAEDLGFIQVDIFENGLRKSEFELSLEIERIIEKL